MFSGAKERGVSDAWINWSMLDEMNLVLESIKSDDGGSEESAVLGNTLIVTSTVSLKRGLRLKKLLSLLWPCLESLLTRVALLGSTNSAGTGTMVSFFKDGKSKRISIAYGRMISRSSMISDCTFCRESSETISVKYGRSMLILVGQLK